MCLGEAELRNSASLKVNLKVGKNVLLPFNLFGIHFYGLVVLVVAVADAVTVAAACSK